MAAIFVSVFLFFLSVALVAQNRQNIQLALQVDHKLRAESAARAGLNWGLHQLRTNPKAREDLKYQVDDDRDVRKDVPMESGATWSLRPLVDYPEGGQDHLLLLEASGTSGFMTVNRRMVVEEIVLSRRSPGEEQPILFAWRLNDSTGILELAMMEGFEWRPVTYVFSENPDPTSPPQPGTWLAARGGPLFVHAEDRDFLQPRNLFDYFPDGEGGTVRRPVEFGRNPDGSATGTPFREKVVSTLEFTDTGLGNWRRLPTPSEKAVAQGGLVREAAATPLEQLTPGSDYVGPSYEFYILEGSALVADEAGDESWVYSHARHHFYRGARGTVTSIEIDEAGVPVPVVRLRDGEDGPGRFFNRTAVVRYSLDSDRWEAVADLMEVENLRQDPVENATSPVPMQDSLGVAGTRYFAYGSTGDNQPPQILSWNGDAWAADRSKPVDSLVSRGLYTYGDDVLYQTVLPGSQSALPGSTWTTYGLSNAPTLDGLPVAMSVGEMAPVWDPVANRWVQAAVRPGVELLASLQRGANCVATLQTPGSTGGWDLYSFVTLRRAYNYDPTLTYFEFPGPAEIRPYSQQWLSENSQRDSYALAHYDGQRWQLWPGGSYEFLHRLPPGTREDFQRGVTLAKDSQGNPMRLATSSLAAAVYPGRSTTGTGATNRFVPVVVMP